MTTARAAILGAIDASLGPFHDLRGTAASHMHALGAELKVIQAALGHTDGRTTMNLYTHALPDGLRANADRMNVLFESEG